MYAIRSYYEVRDLQNKMREIADGEGDLTKQLEIFEFNEMGELTGTINDFLGGLRYLLKDVKDLGVITSYSIHYTKLYELH